MFDKRKLAFLIVVLLLVISITACTVQEEEPAVTYPEPASNADLAVVAEGEVLPVEDRMLSFDSGGILNNVPVEEGQTVQAGDVLAVLGNTSALDAQRAALDLELLTAQQALDDLQQNADVDREQAWQAVLDAQEVFDAAQQAYDELDQDAYEDDLEQAEEEIIDARQKLEDARDDLAEYQDLDSENATRQRYEDDVEQAEDALNEKMRAKTALQTEHDRIESAYVEAEAALQVAQEEYQNREDGPDADQLAQVEAQIESIQAQIAAVEEELDNLTLTAPFAGEVVRLYYTADEFVAPGMTILRLADTSQWVVESTDLTELEVAELAVGQSVQIEAEAFPEERFSGTIERISSYPEKQQGDVLYTVRITMDADQTLPALRWGMTVTLTFE